MRFRNYVAVGVLLATLTAAGHIHAQGAVSSLRRLLESGRVPAERQGAILEMICTRGEADDLAVPFKLLIESGKLSSETRRRVAELLLDAAVTRKVKPSGDLAPITKLIDGADAAKDRRLQASAIKLAATWQVSQAAAALTNLATTDKTPTATRQAAIEGLATLGGSKNRESIEQLAFSGENRSVRLLASAALARIDSTAAAKSAAALLVDATAADDLAPLLDALLSRQDGADVLADALIANKPSPDAAKLALRHIYSVGRSDAKLSDALSKAAGVALDAPPPGQEAVAKIVENVLAHGDPARGEKVFRRADLSCLKCHSVSGAGGSVGPDLSPVGSISPPDYIVNSILNPNLAIKEQFVTRRVLTTDGEIITGIQVDRDDQRLRLRDATGKLVSIPADNIDQEGEGPSLMPQGLTKFLTDQEFLDLARFISELGKPGPYAIRRTATIQRWRVLKKPADELTTQVPNVEIFRELVLDAPPDDWSSAYATVAGTLPLAEFAPQHPTVLYLQGEIEVTEAGLVGIDITCKQPTYVWLDAEPFETTKRFERPLTVGRHTVTLRVEIPASTDSHLQVECTKPTGSAAQFTVVGGM